MKLKRIFEKCSALLIFFLMPGLAMSEVKKDFSQLAISGSVYYEWFSGYPENKTVFNIWKRYQGYTNSGVITPNKSEKSPYKLYSLLASPYYEKGSPFSLRLLTMINIKKSGDYSFSLTSDDGAAIFINGQLVVNNDRVKSERSNVKGTVYLQSGINEIEVLYFNDTGDDFLDIYISGADTSNKYEHLFSNKVDIRADTYTLSNVSGLVNFEYFDAPKSVHDPEHQEIIYEGWYQGETSGTTAGVVTGGVVGGYAGGFVGGFAGVVGGVLGGGIIAPLGFGGIGGVLVGGVAGGVAGAQAGVYKGAFLGGYAGGYWGSENGYQKLYPVSSTGPSIFDWKIPENVSNNSLAQAQYHYARSLTATFDPSTVVGPKDSGLYGLRFKGSFDAESNDTFYFIIDSSDSPVKLLIDDIEVISSTGASKVIVDLARGKHSFVLEYKALHKNRSNKLQVSYYTKSDNSERNLIGSLNSLLKPGGMEGSLIANVKTDYEYINSSENLIGNSNGLECSESTNVSKLITTEIYSDLSEVINHHSLDYFPQYEAKNIALVSKIQTSEALYHLMPEALTSDSYGIRYSLEFEESLGGLYQFSLTAHDAARIFVDGKKIVDTADEYGLMPIEKSVCEEDKDKEDATENCVSESIVETTGVINLGKGKHSIVIEYFQKLNVNQSYIGTNGHPLLVSETTNGIELRWKKHGESHWKELEYLNNMTSSRYNRCALASVSSALTNGQGTFAISGGNYPNIDSIKVIDSKGVVKNCFVGQTQYLCSLSDITAPLTLQAESASGLIQTISLSDIKTHSANLISVNSYESDASQLMTDIKIEAQEGALVNAIDSSGKSLECSSYIGGGAYSCSGHNLVLPIEVGSELQGMKSKLVINDLNIAEPDALSPSEDTVDKSGSNASGGGGIFYLLPVLLYLIRLRK